MMADIGAMNEQSGEELLGLATEIVSAYVSHNSLGASDVPRMITDVYNTLAGLGQPVVPVQAELVPAVPVRKSVTGDYIVCLDDGKKFKSLKRHLTLLGMTPDQYRSKWSLPSDYPMVAPNYAATRSDLAKKIGLGRPRAEPVAPVVAEAPKRKRAAKAAA